ncbi:MAG: hypothetical protein CVV41_19435 [Candidatus Riflebacteria bacterium HGW-Riflebacteria-1]|nr:MAG: hypothetical protein CVV41_19435 [Candidatus Riflebacteria bacterium HGW-Riflebacteria-1]
MKRLRSLRLCILVALAVFFSSMVTATGSFVATSEGIRYIVRDESGNITQTITPEFDARSGKYYVRGNQNRIISQTLSDEAAMTNFKLVTPVDGRTSVSTTKDFMGNTTDVLKSLPNTDPRYQQLKTYIENNAGLRQTISMQVEARNYKINQIKNDLAAGTRDPAFAEWLTNDLKKPVYLEVGDSGGVHHDARGFVLAEQGANGQVAYRDNSYVNRIVIPSNSEVFNGGMQDPSAASVIAHETGHMIMDQLYERNNYPATNYYGAHSKNTVSDEGFALSEGWAEAIEALSTKEYHDNATSWRIKTHKNIADNKYVFKNQGVTTGPNDGILKNGMEMLSTEGVNASLFYDVLESNRIQAPYSKICQVFETAKPQTYRDFVDAYIQKYPEDRSQMIKQFLENTKYATVDNKATIRYKEVHDAQQAWQNAADPTVKSQLKAEYDSKLASYKDTNEALYKQAVVEGKVDGAIDGTRAFSDETASEFRSLRLSETLIKGQKALGQGFQNAASSIKQSFSAKNLAMTAGTSIAINLASQLMNGQKVSVKDAVKSVASMQFVGNVVGSSLGAAAGQVFTPLIQTFVPIPIVGTIAGALLPTLTALVGGSLGGNLGAGMGFKAAIKALDPVAIAGQAAGSTIGAMLGSMIPIPIVGTMLGSIVGGIIGEKLFSSIAKLFGYRKDKPQAQAASEVQPAYLMNSMQSVDTMPRPAAKVSTPDADPLGVRLTPDVDKIPYSKMHPNLKKVKDLYEASYKAYVQAISSGDQALAKQKLTEFTNTKARYERALKAYTK